MRPPLSSLLENGRERADSVGDRLVEDDDEERRHGDAQRPDPAAHERPDQGRSAFRECVDAVGHLPADQDRDEHAQPDREEDAKGPPAQAAFKDGKPTKAAEGFARSRGATVEDLEIRSTDKGDFVFVTQKITGRRTADILIDLVPDWILRLDGKRLMRWGDGDVRFSRPLRWLVDPTRRS